MASKTPSSESAPASETEGAKSPAAGGKLKLIGFAVAATLAGAAIGWFVLGPRISAPGEVVAEQEADAGHGSPKAGHGPPKLVKIENIVVNPAGSEGLRFLMVSVAFEVSDPAAESRLRDAEVQVRDIVTGVFERQTMAQLTRTGARDSLKVELAAAVHVVAGKSALRVYLPQFVIQ